VSQKPSTGSIRFANKVQVGWWPGNSESEKHQVAHDDVGKKIGKRFLD
jgi:hypothetical protein